MTSPSTPPRSPVSGVRLLAAGVLAVSVVGFFTGTRAPPAPEAPRALTADTGTGLPMPSYRGLRDAPRGPNAQVHATEFQRLRDEVQRRPAEDASLPLAVGRRRERRAYDGAPPTVPHPVGQQSRPACLVCHERGAVVDGLVARAMSHPRSDNCLQCHVVMEDPRPAGARATGPLTENTFLGATDVRGGTRAWRGAPPTIPHAPEMRGVCTSCHGPAGEAGLRSSHPERANCLQCHAFDSATWQTFPRVQASAPSERAFP